MRQPTLGFKNRTFLMHTFPGAGTREALIDVIHQEAEGFISIRQMSRSTGFDYHLSTFWFFFEIFKSDISNRMALD